MAILTEKLFSGGLKPSWKITKIPGGGGSKAKCPIWGGMAIFWNYTICIQKNWVCQDPFSIKNRQFPLFPMFIVPVSFKQIFICLFLPKNC